MAAGQTALDLSLAVNVHSGAKAFGRCTGPRPIEARFHVRLEPGVDATGRAVVFEPVGAEIRRADGSAGLLARAASQLADRLIVPRLDAIEINVSGPLVAIDDLVMHFMPATTARPSPLADRAHLAHVEVDRNGLAAALALTLHALPDAEVHTEAPLDDAELTEWQRIEDELDGFLTAIIVHLADAVDMRDLQLDLLGVLIDSRHRIAEALREDSDSDQVEALFLQAWDALRPLFRQLDALAISDDVDLRLAGFLAAGDALTAVQALGPEYGLEVSRDGLRRLARLLLAEQAPARFTPLPLEIDPRLQRLLGLEGVTPRTPAAARRHWLDWLIPAAHAADDSPAEALRGLVPRLAFLDDYLDLVSDLLAVEIESHLGANTRLDDAQRPLFDPLVRATAWKESCWRHYVGRVDEPEVIRSSVGAVGMMQIMGRVWRGVYDVERLERDVQYNVAAGIEILEHYLVDYAIRRGEHEQPGGIDNLVRATYAAYNGGPSHLPRYRREDTPGRLRAIDREFWNHYQQMKTEQWPYVASCYAVGG
ncbi:transglycosylase SLT domain-containing protein [Wenzhouxiangella sp. AB-CW3]|nr:transglycosylase SLT domain-containing protein [Wenzhouxiangella sp. AB-CW3]